MQLSHTSPFRPKKWQEHRNGARNAGRRSRSIANALPAVAQPLASQLLHMAASVRKPSVSSDIADLSSPDVRIVHAPQQLSAHVLAEQPALEQLCQAGQFRAACIRPTAHGISIHAPLLQHLDSVPATKARVHQDVQVRLVSTTSHVLCKVCVAVVVCGLKLQMMPLLAFGAASM